MPSKMPSNDDLKDDSAPESDPPESKPSDLGLNFSTQDLPVWSNPSLSNSASRSTSCISPKLALKNFILATIATEDVTEYSFTIPGCTSLDEASAYIHRMRVELSRQRKRVIDSGRKPKRFRINIISMGEGLDETTEEPFYKVHLSTVHMPEKINEMDEIMDALSLKEE